jgi:hypothetical protein
MILTEQNYYSSEANWAYFSASQFKSFDKCPASAMAELNGIWTPPASEALVLGSYVDEMLTGTEASVRLFRAEHSELFNARTGELKAPYRMAEETVERVRQQPKMMDYLSGQHQVIMTGEIEGVPFKIKMDSFHPGRMIVDLKYMKSLRSPNAYVPMVQYWGYDVQGAIYQEIVRQNTGDRLPFFLCVATKETPARLALGEINQINLNAALGRVRSNIERHQRVKMGELLPWRCEAYDCDFCAATAEIGEPIDTDFFGYSAAQLDEIKMFRGEGMQ